MKLRVIAFALLIEAILTGRTRHAGSRHPSEKAHPFQGIDVSHHQGTIAWHLLKAQGVDFAYIKASEGADRRDPSFLRNRRGALSAGIPYGAYHYFTLCRSGADQAANFIAAVRSHPADLPPTVDLEFGGNCARRPSRSALIREIGAFLNRIETHTGRRAMLYTTGGFEARYHVTEAFDRRLWLRRLHRHPQFAKRPWTIWQSSASRRLRGIKGPVDWNVARVDLARIGPAFGSQGRAEESR
jgi:lysozyme